MAQILGVGNCKEDCIRCLPQSPTIAIPGPSAWGVLDSLVRTTDPLLQEVLSALMESSTIRHLAPVNMPVSTLSILLLNWYGDSVGFYVIATLAVANSP
jgi:hypothetical protein